MLDFRFTNNTSRTHIDNTGILLTQPRLWVPGGDYPAHNIWREKALTELENEQKRSMLAYWGKEAVGAIVYQRSKTEPTVLEIKNISVERAARGRHVADFLLRQVEVEGLVDFPGCIQAQVDTKITNTGLLIFAERSGYQIAGITELDAMGHNGVADVVLSKRLDFAT